VLLPNSRLARRSSARDNSVTHFFNTLLEGGIVQGKYLDFSYIGDSTTPAISAAVTGAAEFSLENSVFEYSGGLRTTYNVGHDTSFRLRNVTFRNTLGETAARIDAPYPLTPGKVREVLGCVFDKPVHFYPPTDFTIRDTLFDAGYDVTAGVWTHFDGNFIRHSGEEHRIAGSVSNNYWFVDNPLRENPHFLQAASYGLDETIDGEIFEFGGMDSNGDAILLGLSQNPVTTTIKNCLVLPNSARRTSGTLFSALGNENTSLVVENNTYIASFGSPTVGETYSGHTNMLKSFRWNLAWSPVADSGYKLFARSNISDLVLASNADFNCGYNLEGGSSGNGYDGLVFLSGVPGVYDIEVDPQFLDSSRNISHWDISLGGVGTAQHALSQLRKKNDALGYDSRFSIENLRTYVRDGFAPGSPTLSGTLHGGRKIGAVSAPSTPPVTPTATPIAPTATPVPPSPTSTPSSGGPPPATPTPQPTPTPTATPTPPKFLFDVSADLPFDNLFDPTVPSSYNISGVPQANWSLSHGNDKRSSEISGSTTSDKTSATVTITSSSEVSYSDVYGPVWVGAGTRSGVTVYVRKERENPRITVVYEDSFTTNFDGYASAGYSGLAKSSSSTEPSGGDTKVIYLDNPHCAVFFPDTYPGVTYCRGTLAAGSWSSAGFVLGPHSGSGTGKASGTTTIKVYDGQMRKPKPGRGGSKKPKGKKGPKEPCVSEGGPFSGTTVDPISLNSHTSISDPITTRGYPLTMNIHVSSQAVEVNRPIANGSFTYDIHVTRDYLVDADGYPRWHTVLVDGDGSRWDYGSSDLAEPEGEPGVYGKLRRVPGGWVLYDAGAPESIDSAGHFRYMFDGAGHLTEVQDANGNVQALTYGANGKLLKVTDQSTFKKIEFGYTGDFVSRIVEAGGAAVTLLGYTSDSSLLSSVEVKNPDNTRVHSVSLEYVGRAVTAITYDGDPASRKNFSYDWIPALPEGQLLIPIIKEADGISFKLRYHGPETVVEQRDRQGHLEEYSYVLPEGHLRSIRRTPLPGHAYGTTSFTYDNRHNLLTVSPSNPVTTYSYDEHGNVNKILWGDNFSTYYDWSDLDLLRIRDDKGLLWEYSYENPGLPHSPTSAIDALGNEWLYSYNSYGQVTKIIPPLPQGETTLVYDEDPLSSSFGYLKEAKDGAGRVTKFLKYSPLGDLLEWSTSPNATRTNIWKASYDSGRRLTSVTYPDGKTRTFEYQGRFLREVKDELNAITRYTFCPNCGGLDEVTGPLSHKLKFTRDADRDIIGFTDARGHTTAYERTESGKVVKETLPDGRTTQYQWGSYREEPDISWIPGTIERRDEYRNSTGKAYAIVQTGGTWGIDKRMTYNSDGTLATSRVFDDANHTYEYDLNRRLISDTFVTYDPKARVQRTSRVEYQYNGDGSEKTIRWLQEGALVMEWAFTYDGTGSMTSVSNSKGETTTLVYDGEGKLTEELFSNGTKSLYAYDQGRGWVTGIEYLNGSTLLSGFAIKRDAGGKITEVVEGPVAATTTYTYDELYRLVSENGPAGSFSYAYDLAGNITSMSGVGNMTYDAGNKIASIPGGAVSYDAAGRVTSIRGTGVTGVDLQWHANGTLLEQATPGGRIRHDYDADDKRSRSQVLNPGGTLTQVRIGVYAGERLIGEVVDGFPEIAYTWSDIGLISQHRLLEGESFWYVFGPQQETRTLTSSTGAIVASYRYSAYGGELAASGFIYNPFRYAGRVGCYREGDAKLLLCRHRWYSPEIGRWLTRDPIGSQGGENQYAYVSGDPVDQVDPSGQYGTGSCEYYERRCLESGGTYYCEKAPYWCKKFPVWPDPDPSRDDDREGWARCVRQCLMDCDQDENKHQNSCPSVPDDRKGPWDPRSTSYTCHHQCYRWCFPSGLTGNPYKK